MFRRKEIAKGSSPKHCWEHYELLYHGTNARCHKRSETNNTYEVWLGMWLMPSEVDTVGV